MANKKRTIRHSSTVDTPTCGYRHAGRTVTPLTTQFDQSHGFEIQLDEVAVEAQIAGIPTLAAVNPFC
jgi:hypothetical protein